MDKYNILEKYCRPIIHMRQQLLTNKKFGLVFGSGISKDFHLPNWDELIQRIANSDEVCGVEILNFMKKKSPQASVTQMLFEHFKSQKLDEFDVNGKSESSKNIENQIYIEWRNIIHRELWKNFSSEYLEVGKHPYLDAYVDIIKKSSLTINYNFDDTLQTIINNRKSEEERRQGKKNY